MNLAPLLAIVLWWFCRPLPDGVVARVGSHDVTEQELAAFIGAETRHEEAAADLLQLIEHDRVIELEATRRHVSVDDAEVEAAFSRLDQRARREPGSEQGLEAALAKTGVSRDAFMHQLSRLLLVDSMARQDFKLPAGAEVSPEKQNLWIQDHVAGARIVPSDAPDVVATVEDTPITTEELGRRYLPDLVRTNRRDRFFLDKLVRIVAIEAEAARLKIALSDADVSRAIADRESRMRQKPDMKDAALDDVLKKIGWSVAQLKSSRSFRGLLLMERLVDQRFGGAALERWFDEHHADLDKKLGASVELATVYLRAGDGGKRGVEDVEMELTALKGRVERGEIDFATAVATRSEHSSKAQGGSLGPVHAGTPGFEPLFAAANGAADGALVGPIRTQGGVHLVKVLKHVPAPPFSAIKDAVKAEAQDAYCEELIQAANVMRRE